jgi:hypothetical protein
MPINSNWDIDDPGKVKVKAQVQVGRERPRFTSVLIRGPILRQPAGFEDGCLARIRTLTKRSRISGATVTLRGKIGA